MDITYWILFRGFYHYFGKKVNEEYRLSKKEYFKKINNTYLICAICDKPLSWKDKTIDHIIPENIIWEYGLVGLIFDHRNFRIVHQECNVKRGVCTIDDLSDSIRNRLLTFQINEPS